MGLQDRLETDQLEVEVSEEATSKRLNQRQVVGRSREAPSDRSWQMCSMQARQHTVQSPL